MSLILIACGIGLVMLPGATKRFGRSARPSTWAMTCVVALVSGTTLVEIGLLLYATPSVLRAIGGADLANFCQKTLDFLMLGGPVAGWLALSAALVVAGGFVFGLRKARRVSAHVRVEPSCGTHEPLGDHELVILPADAAFAVSVRGRPGQVVVSDGLADALTEAELAAVLRHEKAHLDLKHQALLTATSAVEHAFYFCSPVEHSAHALRSAIERWADEAATAGAPEAREPLRQALIKVTGSLIASTIPALSGADTVAERLEALGSDPCELSKARFGLLIAPGLVLGGGGLGVCLVSVWSMVAMVGHCPT
jgi:Peptidase family M48